MSVTSNEAVEMINSAMGAPPRRAWLKKWGLLALAGLILLAIGYGSGRYAQPAKVITQVKTDVQVQEKVVYKDRVVTQVVTVHDRKRDVHTVTEVVKKPDGTTSTVVTKDEHENSGSKTEAAKTETSSKVEKETAEQKTDSKTVTPSAKNGWRVHAGVGVSVPYFLFGQAQPGVPNMRGAVVDFGLDRRVAGPFWLGISADTQGTLALDLSAVF